MCDFCGQRSWKSIQRPRKCSGSQHCWHQLKKEQMATEKLRTKVTVLFLSELVLFYVNSSKSLGNKPHDHCHLKKKYRHLGVLHGYNMDRCLVQVVLRHENYHLISPVECSKCNGIEHWAAKTKDINGMDIERYTPQTQVVQVAATSHADDGMGKQLKFWFNMVSYATRVNVTGHSKRVRFLSPLEKTTKLVDCNIM